MGRDLTGSTLAPARIVHLAPHVGGGVGTALAALVREDKAHRHDLVCLEAPTRTGAVDAFTAAGGAVHIAPQAATLAAALASADAVQIELWNHPALIAALRSLPPLPLRLLLWCHTAGTSWPCFPLPLLRLAQRVVFTSSVSLRADGIDPRRCAVVSSAAPVDHLPLPVPRDANALPRLGCVGTLSKAKLHPDFVPLLAAALPAGQSVAMIGDPTEAPALLAECAALGRPDLLHFEGWCSDMPRRLRQLDVLLHLLQPSHYGTGENALVEAMAMGVVPLVWRNAAELELLRGAGHVADSAVVDDLASLRVALEPLLNDGEHRARLSAAVCQHARAQFRTGRLSAQMSEVYRAALAQPKRTLTLAGALGTCPADAFRLFLPAAHGYRDDGTVALPRDRAEAALMRSPTKGSALHFARVFPDDFLLAAWARALSAAA